MVLNFLRNRRYMLKCSKSKNILIILGHPALKRQSLCESLANAYMDGAIESDHDVRLYKIADKIFDPILHEGYAEEQMAEPDIIKARADISWADHIVFVYPLWAFMIPALLKGFLERTFVKGFAFEVSGDSRLLAGKSVRLIQTSGMPTVIYRFWYRAHGAKALCDILGFCGFKPVRASYFGMVETTNDKKRNQWLNEIKKLGAKGI